MKNYTTQELISIFTQINANQPSGIDPGDGWLDLFNRTILRIYNYENWTWLVKNIEIQATNGVITLPSDFFDFSDVYSGEQNSRGLVKSPVFNVTKNAPVNIIKRNQRFRLKADTSSDTCYLDMANNSLRFLNTGITDNFTFDYVYTPDYITEPSTQTVLPRAMQPSVPHLMSLEFAIIENEDPDRNFDAKNLKTFEEYLKPFRKRHLSLIQYGKN